jgi:TPR repeat protein
MARMDVGEAFGSPAESKPSGDDLFELGIFYSAGNGSDADLVEAHKWFNLAAMRGNAEAAIHRQELAREMSDAEVASAQRAAREWLTRH